MGQGQSTNHQGNSEPNEEAFERKDYYELLEVEQDALPDEIKKAYRKKALELHPDRNYGNVEAATELFAEVQSAYEVLSDPQERSWYDSHRDAFLGSHGGTETTGYFHNTEMTTSADILKLFSRFSPHMEFSDSPSGFYGGLCETFARLAKEEEIACRWENIDIIDYPSFGSRDDDFEITRQFYSIWSSFSTRKSFSWKESYRYSEAPDRRVRRLMEKENKRLREAAIREFNDAVRSLVAFVKKRDPRYKSYKENQSQHHEVLRQSVAAQATRSRAANQAKLRSHVVQDWAKSEEVEENGTESSEDEAEHFECIVCRKTFKSQNQFQAHERSKKHIKAVKQLCWEMRVQHDELDLKESTFDQGEEGMQAPHLHHSGQTISSYNPPGQTIRESDDKIPQNMSSKDVNPDAAIIEVPAGSDYIQSTGNITDADYASREFLENRLGLRDSCIQTKPGEKSIDELSQKVSSTMLSEGGPPSTKKIGKAKQKRARKAQLAMERSQSTECIICNASFPSRNKLFSHIKLNHS